MKRIPIREPAESAGELYYKTPVTPEEAFQAIGRLRKEARDEIDRLIRFLDDTDDHMEREPEDEGDDCELEEDDHGEDDGCGEPSLGALERPCSCYGLPGYNSVGNQSSWALSGLSDCELDDSDHEEDDPEEMSEESGIGDLDGMEEQWGARTFPSGLTLQGAV